MQQNTGIGNAYGNDRQNQFYPMAKQGYAFA